MFLDCVIGRRGIPIQLPPSILAKNINLKGYRLLLTIPGFGPYISSLVLGVIGHPYRFESQKQVIRLAGLDLNANRSDKTSNDSVPVISKNGSREGQ